MSLNQVRRCLNSPATWQKIVIVIRVGQTNGHRETASLNRSAPKMKHLLPLIALFWLAGCTTPPVKVQTAQPKPAAPVASLEVHRANPIEFFTGYEARCEIHSIDGVSVVDSNYELLPGNHTLTVSLSHLGHEYTGDVDLVIPEARRYELKAKRKGDAFMLSIVDVGEGKIIATSIAPLNDHMKFLVFVVQK